LFPIQHGILYYAGIEVLPPFVLHGTHSMTREDHTDLAKAWEQRLLALESTDPIAFRRQNFGDYEIPSLRLKEGLEQAGRTGLDLHLRG
jgi:NAD(P)H dehydrogenase (quinone)